MWELVPRFLWIGNARDARDIASVVNIPATTVIDLAIEEPPIQYPREVVYCRFPLVDGGGNSPGVLRAAVDTTAHFVRFKLPTLVSCGGGMSRSPAVVAAALATLRSIAPEDALEQLAARGPHDISATLWDEIKRAASS